MIALSTQDAEKNGAVGETREEGRGKRLLSRVRDIATRFSAWNGTPFLVGFLVVVAVGALVYWFVFYSGLGAPPGFVYNQF